MKLIIQIPCYNEADSLPITVADLPTKIEGIDIIETLIINDGSKDQTLKVAKSLGINHIVNFRGNRGLAKAFEAGINECLRQGADIIVNTDADNQYYGPDIAKLVAPIVRGEADVVVGDRQTNKIKHFSGMKKLLQKAGSYAVRRLSKTDIQDAVSGFRAFSRETAMKLNIVTDFSYTIENIIQLGYLKVKIISVPIRTNSKLRDSRLFKSIPSFIRLQLTTLLRVYSNYKSLKFFTVAGILIMIPGIIGFFRFIYFYLTVGGEGHIQSLIFSTVLLNVGFLVVIFGLIADLVTTNRKLLEKILEHNKKDQWEKKS